MEKPFYDFYPNAIDSHVHLFNCSLEGINRLMDFEQQFGYQAFNFLSCECMDDCAQNALGIYLKLLAPHNYAFGGLHYRFAYDYAREAGQLIELGFDGMKMVENKPTLRKRLNKAVNDPAYDDFYAYMEESKTPMIIHIADPEEFWDKKAIPAWAEAAGYYYGDGSFVSKEQLYDEAMSVLERFRGLRAIFAHFFFMSADRDRLGNLFNDYPNIGVDIAAGTEMYFNFSKEPKVWREFFIKYQDRIIFGTDNMNLSESNEITNALISNRMEHAFLRSNDKIPVWDKEIVGIGLPQGVQDKIFRLNFQRIAGEKPKKINIEAAMDYLKRRLIDSRLYLTKRERHIIQTVYDICKEYKNKGGNIGSIG